MNQNNSLDSLLQQGHLLLERGQYETALATFQEADKRFPENPQVKYGLGLACFRLERFQQSVKYLTQSLELGSPLAPLNK
jgi:Flp pilus assembly protein TadD